MSEVCKTAAPAYAIRIWADVSKALGLKVPMPAWQIVKEKRATFAATPDQDARRPGAQTQWRKIRLGEAAGTARRLRSVLDRGATCGAGNGTTRIAVAFIRTKLIERDTGLCLDSSLKHKPATLFQSTTRFSDYLFTVGETISSPRCRNAASAQPDFQPRLVAYFMELR